MSQQAMELAKVVKVDCMVVEPEQLDQWVATTGAQSQERCLIHVVDRVVHADMLSGVMRPLFDPA